MEKAIERTMKFLKRRNFHPLFARNREEARDLTLQLIPKIATVGIGDSSSVRQIGIIPSLIERGTKVINPFDIEKQVEDNKLYAKYVFRSSIEAMFCDVFLTGTNAVTQDGRLLNIDAAGNRVAGMIWGHPQVILAVGRNKIVEDLDEGLERIKNVIAPQHISRRGMHKSPSRVTGKCEDCIGGNRLCNVTTIMEGSPFFSAIHVLIVGEDLGLGWDASWKQDRVDAISKHHDKFMWSMPEDAMKCVSREELWSSVKDICSSKI